MSLQRKANAQLPNAACTALHCTCTAIFFSFLFEILLEEGRIRVVGQSRSQFFFFFSIQCSNKMIPFEVVLNCVLFCDKYFKLVASPAYYFY